MHLQQLLYHLKISGGIDGHPLRCSLAKFKEKNVSVAVCLHWFPEVQKGKP